MWSLGTSIYNVVTIAMIRTVGEMCSGVMDRILCIESGRRERCVEFKEYEGIEEENGKIYRITTYNAPHSDEA